MYKLTSQKLLNFELHVVITDKSGIEYVFPYKNFQISAESENYKLKLSGYYGLMSDPFQVGTDWQFVTKDHNENHTACRPSYGWWYQPFVASGSSSYYNRQRTQYCNGKPILTNNAPYWSADFSGKIQKVQMRMRPVEWDVSGCPQFFILSISWEFVTSLLVHTLYKSCYIMYINFNSTE